MSPFRQRSPFAPSLSGSRPLSDWLPGQPKLPIYLTTHGRRSLQDRASVEAEQTAVPASPADCRVESLASTQGHEPRGSAQKPPRERKTRVLRDLLSNVRVLGQSTVYLPEIESSVIILVILLFSVFRPKRLVLTLSSAEILGLSSRPIRRFLIGLLIRRAARVSPVTADLQEPLLASFPRAADKILLSPGALCSDFAIVKPRSIQSKEKIIILSVGRLHPRYGQLITLAALQALPEQIRSRIEYWIVGRGSKVSYVEKLRASATADTLLTVRFFGNIPQNELADVYEGATIFALTGINHVHGAEGFELAHFEAASHGLPIVAHDVGSVPEAVRDGSAGILVPCDQLPELTLAFERLICSSACRERLGEAARGWAQINDWRQNTASVLDTAFETASPFNGSEARS